MATDAFGNETGDQEGSNTKEQSDRDTRFNGTGGDFGNGSTGGAPAETKGAPLPESYSTVLGGGDTAPGDAVNQTNANETTTEAPENSDNETYEGVGEDFGDEPDKAKTAPSGGSKANSVDQSNEEKETKASDITPETLPEPAPEPSLKEVVQGGNAAEINAKIEELKKGGIGELSSAMEGLNDKELKTLMEKLTPENRTAVEDTLQAEADMYGPATKAAAMIERVQELKPDLSETTSAGTPQVGGLLGVGITDDGQDVFIIRDKQGKLFAMDADGNDIKTAGTQILVTEGFDDKSVQEGMVFQVSNVETGTLVAAQSTPGGAIESSQGLAI